MIALISGFWLNDNDTGRKCIQNNHHMEEFPIHDWLVEVYLENATDEESCRLTIILIPV